MTTTMSPEAQAAAARALAGEGLAERPVVAELRQELNAVGSYEDAADQAEVEAIFEEQTVTTRDFVQAHIEADADEDRVEVEEAVDVLMEVGQPAIESVVASEVKKAGVDIKTPEEQQEAEDAVRSVFRSQLIAVLTPKDADGDAPKTPKGSDTPDTDPVPAADEDKDAPEADPSDTPERSFSAGIWGKLASAKERFSLTFKETRADYRHYIETQKAIRQFDPGSQERKDAVREMREAKSQYRARVGRTFGVVAVAGFAAESLRTKGLDVTSYVDGGNVVKAVALGAAAPAVAIGVERHRMREAAEKVKDGSLKAQLWGFETVGKVFRGATGGWRKEETINYKKLEKKNPELYKEHKTLKAELAEEDAKLSEWEEQFDHDLDPKYHARVDAYEQREERLQQMEAELQEKYGKRGLSGKAKVVLGIGVLAATGYLAYRIRRDGVPFTGSKSGNGVEHAPTGNNSNNGQAAAESTPPTTGGSGSGAAEQAPEAPSMPHGLGDNARDNWDNLSRDEQIRFNDAWEDMSDKQRAAFNIYTDAPEEQVDALHGGFEAIREAHPNATEDQFNQLVSDTLDLAAKREEYAGNIPVINNARGAVFDSMFENYIEQSNADAIRLASMRDQYIGDGWGPAQAIRAHQFDEMFKRFVEAQEAA